MESAVSGGEQQSMRGRLGTLAGDIKISHTVFALPWACFGAVLAGRYSPMGHCTVGQIALIVWCMVTARTVAMCANRLLDARLDRLNPRTARRAIPSGRLSRAFYTGVMVACIAAFMVGTWGFGWGYQNWRPLRLSVVVLAFVAAYPLLKRFSRLCHYYLGAALALAPVCAWIAIAGRLDVTPLLMAGAVLLWTAGFDILYATQDYTSDLETGVHSMPTGVGIGGALWVARLTHLASAGFIIAIGVHEPHLGTIYFVGAGAAVALLAFEHMVFRVGDAGRMTLAFAMINGVISILLGVCGVIDAVR